MPDHLTPEQRYKNMAAIRAKDTKPEIVVRKFLWSHGYRYRLNYKRLPGKPDVVMRKYKTCIFVNGCFWHGHNVQTEKDNSLSLKSSECCKIPKTNRDFWVKKITRNQERDIDVRKKLASMGWNCITIWECELNPNKRAATLESLLYTLSRIFLHDIRVRNYDVMGEELQRMVADNTDFEYGKT